METKQAEYESALDRSQAYMAHRESGLPLAMIVIVAVPTAVLGVPITTQ